MCSRKNSVALVLSSLLIARLPLFGQSTDPNRSNSLRFPTDLLGRQVCLLVSDPQGVPIQGARVRSEADEIQFTNNDGVACIHVEVGTIALTQVETSAPGYQPQSTVVSASDRTSEVILQRKQDLPSQNTVSADELKPDVRKQAIVLEKQAIESMHKGELEEAEKLFRSALDLLPSSALIRNNLGVISIRRNEFNQAANWFEGAYSVAPRDPVVLTNLGLTRWAQGRLDESFRLLSEAEAHGYSAPRLRYALGMLALLKGNARLAVKHLSAVDERQFAHRSLFLAVGYACLGKKKDASHSLAEYLGMKPARLHPAPLRTALENL